MKTPVNTLVFPESIIRSGMRTIPQSAHPPPHSGEPRAQIALRVGAPSAPSCPHNPPVKGEKCDSRVLFSVSQDTRPRRLQSLPALSEPAPIRNCRDSNRLRTPGVVYSLSFGGSAPGRVSVRLIQHIESWVPLSG